MNESEQRKLRVYYNSLFDQKRLLDSRGSNTNIRGVSLIPLWHEFALLKQDFPNIVPFSVDIKGSIKDKTFSFVAIRSQLSMVLARIEVEINQMTSTPVTETRQFTFINDPKVRSIIERDYNEIQRCFLSNCWKSVLILCGGAIEAILLDLLLNHEADAVSAVAAPNNDINRWNLSQLIDVAVELNLVPTGVMNLSHSLREYRNLVHPGNEIRSNLVFDKEEANIAIEILHMLHRELS
jgi:hypothetical protein